MKTLVKDYKYLQGRETCAFECRLTPGCSDQFIARQVRYANAAQSTNQIQCFHAVSVFSPFFGGPINPIES